MSKVIGIMGESGAGKTTSLEKLNPKETYYIDCDKKGLSWKGWREQYNEKNKNYYCSDYASKIEKVIQGVNDTRPEIKYLVIDTLNGIMVADEMRRSKEKAYDKWMDLAVSIYNIIDKAYTYRNDLTFIFIFHSQTERTDDGFNFTRIKTNGKKLDKIVIESKLTTLLLCKAVDGNYVFETKANKSTVKTPKGAFSENVIPNDITLVLDALKDY